MAFSSVMFPETEMVSERQAKEPPAYFRDLYLDQIVATITAGMQEYALESYFFTPLNDEGTIRYRQEVMKDLEREDLLEEIAAFTQTIHRIAAIMREIQKRLAQPMWNSFNYLEKGRVLNSANVYCEAVKGLACRLSLLDPKSRGLRAFSAYVSAYIQSEAFSRLESETAALRADLSTVRYNMLIEDNCVRVRKCEDEPDHTIEIERDFEKFKQGAVKDYRQKLLEEPHAEHVEAGVLNQVAKLYPDTFSCLDDYCERNMSFMDQTIFSFSREVQFYVAYLRYMRRFRREGLPFCYPVVSRQSKEVRSFGSYDLALAERLIGQGQSVVCNDFCLQGNERIIVVSGPNQGGKTTFARTFGQLHHLASLGCPVAGTEAQVLLFDRIFSHFERKENLKNLRGKLQDDLIRMHDILADATPNSVIVINEILASSSLKDAISIGKELMAKIVELDCLCVFVTFLDELASYSEKNVSMVSTVTPEDPARRTFRIVRSPADGLAYAMHIAEKYRLTYDSLKGRIKS